MEITSLFAAEYGFFLKMSLVVVAVVVAGILIRRRSPQSPGKAD